MAIGKQNDLYLFTSMLRLLVQYFIVTLRLLLPEIKMALTYLIIGLNIKELNSMVTGKQDGVGLLKFYV